MDVGNQRLQLLLGCARRKIGDLRLEGTGILRGRVDDLGAELQDCIIPPAQMGREPGWIRIQSDAQQGIGTLPGSLEI